MRDIKTLIAVIAVALLTGCTTVGPDFQRPATSADDSYAMAGDSAASSVVTLASSSAAARQWWTSFNSAELNALVEQALKGNPTLQQADAALARVTELERAQRGESGPSASLSGEAQRERINTAAFGIEGFPSPTINVFSIGTNLRYNLALFGGERRKDETEAARTEAQRQRTDAACLNLTGAVVSRAIELAALRGQLEALDGFIKVARASAGCIADSHADRRPAGTVDG